MSLHSPHRRQLIQCTLAACALPGLARASSGERRLAFHSPHTGERLAPTVYWAEGRYVKAGLADIAHILRDWRSNEIHPIEPAVLDLLAGVQRLTGNTRPFELISGYRSPRTNRALHNAGRGVALKSLHQYGMAVDIALPGTALRHLQGAAIALAAGGVGYYPRSGFVHVDCGRVRQWMG